MDLLADWRDGGAALSRRAGTLARRASADVRAPAAGACVLAALAVAQAVWTALTKDSDLPAAGGLLASVILIAPSLAATLPLGFGWSQPAAAAVVICAANLLSLAAFRLLTLAGLAAQLIICYRLGRRGPQLLAACLAVPFLILGLVVAVSGAGRPAPQRPAEIVLALLAASLGPAAASAGTGMRLRSTARQDAASREAIAGTLLEHTARGERARIARELHDVVAHHISMIAVQAETARLTTPGMPAAGAQRLSGIGDTARAALTEMRRLLGVLREDTGAPPAELEPQPGLAQLNTLLDEARDAARISARLIVRGWLTTLDPGVELTAYRIVQEALTNARRHAPGAAVDVELHFTQEALLLRIRDNGPGPPASAPDAAAAGHGLTGMRERAAAVGGELRTGPAPGGGFLVEATLPAKPSEYAA
ncbi:MAG TPA: sensor histidine kinase [Streptosporangiaceae bacterium]|nr:sensor histidine kinase [Streptosporangiaceae bacterium]